MMQLPSLSSDLKNTSVEARQAVDHMQRCDINSQIRPETDGQQRLDWCGSTTKSSTLFSHYQGEGMD